MPVAVLFFDSRRGEEHPSVGPFEFVQMTHDLLRDDRDNHIAHRTEDREWHFDSQKWSDFTVRSV